MEMTLGCALHNNKPRHKAGFVQLTDTSVQSIATSENGAPIICP